jgi:hypothetical protein
LYTFFAVLHKKMPPLQPNLPMNIEAAIAPANQSMIDSGSMEQADSTWQR